MTDEPPALRQRLPWLAATGALVIVLGGLALVGPRFFPTADASPAPARPASPGASALGLASPGSTAEPTDPRIPEPIDNPGPLTNGSPLDRDHGFAMTRDGRHLMTASGGVRWRDITPPGLSSDVVRIWFLDPVRGWFGEFDEAARDGLILWRTVDAGRTWVRTEVPGVRAVNWQLEFLDENVGWLGSDPGGQRPKPELRWTDDGGLTWSDPIDLAAATGEATFPDTMDFVDTRRGFITDRLGLRRTNDGGRTWHPVELPDPPERRGTLEISGLRFVDPAHGFLRLRDRLEDFSDAGSVVFATDDGGDTWRNAFRFEGEDRRSYAFVDALRWVFTDGERVWRTPNGGVTWQVDPVSGLPDPLRGVRLLMADAEVGWAMVSPGEPCVDFGCGIRTSELFKTTDGGRTWTRLGDCEPGNEVQFVCPPLPSES